MLRVLVLLIALLGTACGRETEDNAETLLRPVKIFRVVDTNLIMGRAISGTGAVGTRSDAIVPHWRPHPGASR